MIPGEKKDKGLLFTATLMLIFAITLFLRGHASLFGIEQISGTQAIVVAISCLVYATLVFLFYFRNNG